MSYIDKSLGAGETVIARAHFHWLYNLSAWLQLLVPAIVFVVVLSWAGEQPNFMTSGNPMTWLVAVVALWLVLGVIAFLRLMIRKWTTEIGITSHRFIKKTGFIALRTNEIALPNIEGVKVHQGILGRVLGFGELTIEGTGVDAVRLPTIADPVAFRRAIETAKGMK
jgi:uncharacterized membrane protein YdbT with pleckstrin-like domain